MRDIEIDSSDILNYIVKIPEVGSKISRCMSINGKVESCEPIIVDGRVHGDIKSSDSVIIQRGAFVKGNIFAKEVKIDGKIDGSIEANSIEIAINGELEGYMVANTILIQGKSDGEILANDTLYITKDALVKTYEAKAKYIKTLGYIVGNVVAQDCIEIGKNGVIEGELLTNELKSNKGSRVIGSINRYKDNIKTNKCEIKKSPNKVIRKVKRLR